ncbi:hypothetical protein QNM99_22230 [Pseudomonas sp. PCH446]
MVVATLAEDALSDTQLSALSRSGAALIVQVILPKDNCTLQQKALDSALQQLQGPATLVSGVGRAHPWPGTGWRPRPTTRPRPSRWASSSINRIARSRYRKPRPTATGWWPGTTVRMIRVPLSCATSRMPKPASATTTSSCPRC